MTSKRAADAKRAVIPRGMDRTKEFIKDWERENASGRSKMADAKTVMLLLAANEGPLPAQYKDHPLKGDRAGFRACHVQGDLVMIYKLAGKGADEKVIFVRIGSHAEVY